MGGALEARLQLGVAAVTHRLLGRCAFGPAAHVVLAAAAAVHAGGVEGGQFHAAAAAQQAADGVRQQAVGAAQREQAPAGFLQGGPVGDASQAQGVGEVGPLLQQDGDAAVVGLEEDLQD